MKHFFSLLLAAMAIVAGVAGSISKGDHWKMAVFFWCLCAALAIIAGIVGFAESIPKPRLIPIGYGRTNGQIDGLVFINEGQPAHSIAPPEPTAPAPATPRLRYTHARKWLSAGRDCDGARARQSGHHGTLRPSLNAADDENLQCRAPTCTSRGSISSAR